MSEVMTMTGGQECDRMDVNVAQLEELIPENRGVDI
jgi:hypothetical protein